MGDILSGLFGGGSSKEPTITTVTPETPQIPGLNEINQVAGARVQAGNPWTLGQHRAMDYFGNTPSVPNHMPQYNPQQGLAPYNPPNNSMLMGDFTQPHPGLQQPQHSPLAWALSLGQLFSQLGGLYQQQQQSYPTQQQPQADPSIEQRRQQPPTQGGTS